MAQQNPFRLAVIIVAAGRGERAGSAVEGPKQYRIIGDRPVIAHTVATFAAWGHAERIVAVIHPDDVALFDRAVAPLTLSIPLATVFGGPTRQESVRIGLESLADSGITHVMIQDAVRPFLTPALLDRIELRLRAGDRAVLPAIAVADTLKAGSPDGFVAATVPRAGLFAAQTPQSFALADILSAHRLAAEAGRSDFTDDAALAEWQDVPVRLVEGEADNIKLTVRRDIDMAHERLSGSQLPDIRTGNGYDVHQLEAGGGVTLCGIFITHDQRLKGHSDADVAFHALTDAILATCGAGDIGDHFPPSDPQWRGAASRIFLERAADIVRQAGGTILNADVTLIAEAPRIGPHRLAMRQNMAEILGIGLERCSVKATTNETIGFVGRREGIAAIATASVAYGR